MILRDVSSLIRVYFRHWSIFEATSTLIRFLIAFLTLIRVSVMFIHWFDFERTFEINFERSFHTSDSEWISKLIIQIWCEFRHWFSLQYYCATDRFWITFRQWYDIRWSFNTDFILSEVSTLIRYLINLHMNLIL